MLKVLIAVDGSEHANRAMDAVGKMVHSALDLEATLLCVSPEPIFYGDYTAGTIQKIEEDQKKHQNTILANATEYARAHGARSPVWKIVRPRSAADRSSMNMATARSRGWAGMPR